MGSNISREAVIRISYKNKPFLELERHDSDGASKLNLFFIQGGMIPRYLQSLILFRYRISREAESCSYQNYPVLESERHDSERATKRNLFFIQGGMIPIYLQSLMFLGGRISRDAVFRISYKN